MNRRTKRKLKLMRFYKTPKYKVNRLYSFLGNLIRKHEKEICSYYEAFMFAGGFTSFQIEDDDNTQLTRPFIQKNPPNPPTDQGLTITGKV